MLRPDETSLGGSLADSEVHCVVLTETGSVLVDTNTVETKLRCTIVADSMTAA